MMIDADAACAGWYFDPLHQQPVYLFWDHATWRARFVWQDPHAEAPLTPDGSVSAVDEPLTRDIYQRLLPLGQGATKAHTNAGNRALRDGYRMRRLVQVKPTAGDQGVFIQAPVVDERGQCDPLCQVVWLSDDEIPTIIRALQARRREVLEAGWDGGDPSSGGDT